MRPISHNGHYIDPVTHQWEPERNESFGDTLYELAMGLNALCILLMLIATFVQFATLLFR